MSKDFVIFHSIFIIARSLNRSCEIVLLKNEFELAEASFTRSRGCRDNQRYFNQVSDVWYKKQRMNCSEGNNVQLCEMKIWNCMVRLANLIEDGALCVHHFEFYFIPLFSHQSVKVRLTTIWKNSQRFELMKRGHQTADWFHTKVTPTLSLIISPDLCAWLLGLDSRWIRSQHLQFSFLLTQHGCSQQCECTIAEWSANSLTLLAFVKDFSPRSASVRCSGGGVKR